MLEACPSFEAKWHAFVDHWGEGADQPVYLALSDLARHLIAMLTRHDVGSFPEIFTVVETWLTHGDPYVKEAAAIGLLEDLQNAGLHEATQPEQFRRYLLPESAAWWDRLNAFWEGGQKRNDH